MSKLLHSPLLAENVKLSESAKEVISRIAREEASQLSAPPATDDPLCPKRRNRVDHTITEIQTQPDKVQETLREEREAIREAAKHLCQKDIQHIYMTGCGDSVAALGGARLLLEQILNIPCEAVQALDFAYYDNRCVGEKSLVIMLSSSGATLRTLEAMYVAREKGAQTLALSNTPGSILMEECTRGLIIHATRKGWPTQASTAAMAMVMQLGLDMARELSSYPTQELDVLQKELDGVPAIMREVTDNVQEKVKELAKLWSEKEMYLFCAGGPSFSGAFFGTAKIKESTPNYAVAIPLEEFHHYNSIKENDPIFLIAPTGPSVPRARDTLIAARHFGGKTCVITSVQEDELCSFADHVIQLPFIRECFSGLCYCIPVQMFGYYTAMEKFRRAEKEAAGQSQ